MNTLTQANINTVRGALKGAKLAKLDASLAVIQASIAQGSWTPRGSVKAQSGFYQGLCKAGHSHYGAAFGLVMCLSYGKGYDGDVDAALKHLAGEKLPSEAVIKAWVALCNEVREVSAQLDVARPRPVVTKIGLSPKVTKTLTEMNLDIDLPTIEIAKIETRYRDAYRLNKETGLMDPVFNKDGTPAQEPYNVVVWTPGIALGMSRFNHGCEACGKHIPSGRFVPVEAMDKKSGKRIGLWLGCDCAKNIFGVKDVGVEK